MGGQLRDIIAGRERLPAGHAIGRHRHLGAYAIVTLSGSMDQVSYAGRVTMRPGQLLVQPTLDCHANLTSPGGIEILRLPWRREAGLGGLFEVEDIDQIVRIAERDPFAASEHAWNSVRSEEPLAAHRDDWEDLLGADLVQGTLTSLGDWARQKGLARETLSRGFARRFQCTPARFRLEVRTRAAWLRLTGTSEPIAVVAAEAGFADQSHLTRAIKWMTGRSPGHWRASVLSRVARA